MQGIFENALIFATALTPIVLAMVQAIKEVIPLPKNGVPLVAVIIGIILSILAPYLGANTEPLAVRVLSGIIAGLSAVGAFETVFNPRDGWTDDLK